MTATPGDRYLLGSSDAELDHLVAQSQVYETEAGELLDLIGTTTGDHAIDVGCGVLGILHQLSARVGQSGRVVGLDRERRMLDAATEVASRRGLSVEVVQGDATSIGLPSESFDLVHARTLLLNVADPHAVLAEMVRIARSGATVAVQEPDAASWVCDPPHPAWDYLRESVLDAYRRSGKDFNIGRQAGRMLRDAGLTDVRVRPTARSTRAGDYYQTFLVTMAALVRDQVAAAGSVSTEQLDSYRAELRTHLEQPDTITCQPLMWQAWGRKA